MDLSRSFKTLLEMNLKELFKQLSGSNNYANRWLPGLSRFYQLPAPHEILENLYPSQDASADNYSNENILSAVFVNDFHSSQSRDQEIPFEYYRLLFHSIRSAKENEKQ